jgi:SAM-dependent methyltransferase
MQSAQFELHAEVEDRHWWFVARRRILTQLAAQLLPPQVGCPVVVDVGCGTGANLAALADRYRCVGIDTSPAAIRLAQARFPQVEFRLGRAPDDARDVFGQADLVLLTDVLEHVPDDQALLASLVSATRPGCWFLLTVPADPALWSQHDESFGHYRRYDEPRLRQAWVDLPVSVRLCTCFNSRLYPLVRLARWRSRRRGQAAGAAGTDFRLPAPPLNRLLTWLFAGESRRLQAALGGRAGQGYARGVSLLAALRHEPAVCPDDSATTLEPCSA